MPEEKAPPPAAAAPQRPGWGPQPVVLAAGLHLVATPIGAARDITLRALDTLASADVLAAEDTRTLRHLMEIHGIALGGRPLLAYHDHNGPAARPRLLAAMAAGRSVAYASEAGTPLVADPGYQLAREAIVAGHGVFAVPGPSALLAALTVAGLPTDRFLFAGFPPAQAGARKAWMAELAEVRATVVIYESPRRINRTLVELGDTFGKTREVALCRELTKRFETVLRGSLAEIAARLDGDGVRGEVVLVLRAAPAAAAAPEEVEAALAEALGRASLRDAVAEVAARFAVPRREVYATALRRAKGDAT